MIKQRKRLMKEPVVIALISSSSMLSMSMFVNGGYENIESKLCLDNAVPLRQEDGNARCSVQGGFVVFSSLALIASWLVLTIDIMLRSIFAYKSTRQYFLYYSVLVIGYPLIVVVLYASFGMFGYNGYGVQCNFRADTQALRTLSTITYEIPIGLMCITGTVCLCLVMKTYWSVILNLLLRMRRERKVYCSTADSTTPSLSEAGDGDSISVRAKKVLRETAEQGVNIEECVKNGYPRQPNTIQGRAALFLPAESHGGIVAGPESARSHPGTKPESARNQAAGQTNLDHNPAAIPDVAMRRNSSSIEPSDMLQMAADLKQRSIRAVLRGISASTPHVLACIIALVCSSMVLADRLTQYVNHKAFAAGMDRWTSCVFSNFDGVSDASWQGVCGVQPSYVTTRMVAVRYLAVFFGSAQSILCVIVFAKEFWVELKERSKKLRKLLNTTKKTMRNRWMRRS
jgi:hypothetical protein